MHELAITQTITSQIKEECEKNNITPKKISIELGLLTTYKKDSIDYYYNILKKEPENKLLENTILEITEIKGRLSCKNCNKESDIKEPYEILCPLCNSGNIKIIKGKDINLKSIST